MDLSGSPAGERHPIPILIRTLILILTRIRILIRPPPGK